MNKYMQKRKKLLSIDGGSIQEEDENDISESKDHKSSCFNESGLDNQSGMLINCMSNPSGSDIISAREIIPS